MTRKKYYSTLGIILLVGIAPLIPALIAEYIIQPIIDCDVSEAGNCGYADDLFMTFWFAFFSIPAAAIALFIWLIVGLFSGQFRKQKV